MSDIELWRPSAEQIQLIESELSRVFYETFSSPPHWCGKHPLELGNAAQPNTACYFVRHFIQQGQIVLLASGNAPGKEVAQCPILGFAFGGILNQNLLDEFQLAHFGAELGDGVLTFAGIAPLAQGYRIDEKTMNVIRAETGIPYKGRDRGKSLYRMLFEKRLELPELSSCKRIFLRTRQVLSPVVAMATSNGFKYKGSFFTVWQNADTQDRMVYCLER